MAGHHFISYSPVDGLKFALDLCDELTKGPPSHLVWLDKRELQPGDDWDEQIDQAIRDCESLLFVMTQDSVEPQSVCKQEWTRALKFKKPIIPLLLYKRADMPFGLGRRQYIDFTGEFKPALAQLRARLHQLASPVGVLQALQDRLADAQRDLRRANDAEERGRIESEIALLQQQIKGQQGPVTDPVGTARRVEERVAHDLERERQPEKPLSGATRTKFINPPPGVAPGYFQNRFIETKLIGDFVKDEAKRLLTVVGRAGIGKTALVCRVLKALESGRLPDDGGPLFVDGIVYLSATGSRRVTFPDLYADLTELTPENAGKELEALYKDVRATTEAKMRALLAAFPRGRVVVLLDNFEDVIDSATENIRDSEVNEALFALLQLPHHAVKVILTTRIASRSLMLAQPALAARLNLEEGLESPHAENILRELDIDGTVGLKTAPLELLAEARQRTRGYPRALEALFAILSADRYTTLPEVLNDAKKFLPEHVVEKLVGEAFSRLDPAAEKVMQALAVYGRPVPSTAIDYLLQPYLPGVDSGLILNRLGNMHFARREERRYYLHPVDRAYALERIPEGDEFDRYETEEPSFTRYALRERAADYFQEVRKPRAEWKTINDLAPQLDEFDLRCEAQDYDTAAGVLLDIDFDYLLLWGHSREVVKLHERLQGRLDDPNLKQDSLGSLGNAYYRIGRTRNALDCCEQALAIARETGDRNNEGSWLGNLGNCYADLGQTQQAIEHYQQALAIARETGDRNAEGSCLGNLAEVLSDKGHYAEAIQRAMESVQIGDGISSPNLSSYGNGYLALAYLYSGNLSAAHTAANAARQHDEPLNNHYVSSLSGIIALQQGDRALARQAFSVALGQADTLLSGSAQHYAALDSKGLALCGLALTETPNRVSEAMATFRAARAIIKASGVMRRVLRLFDALSVADIDGILTSVRGAAAGE